MEIAKEANDVGKIDCFTVKNGKDSVNHANNNVETTSSINIAAL